MIQSFGTNKVESGQNSVVPLYSFVCAIWVVGCWSFGEGKLETGEMENSLRNLEKENSYNIYEL